MYYAGWEATPRPFVQPGGDNRMAAGMPLYFKRLTLLIGLVLSSYLLPNHCPETLMSDRCLNQHTISDTYHVQEPANDRLLLLKRYL